MHTQTTQTNNKHSLKNHIIIGHNYKDFQKIIKSMKTTKNTKRKQNKALYNNKKVSIQKAKRFKL